MDIPNKARIEVEIKTLKDLRRTHRLSQEEAAEACGLSQAYRAELEAGKRRPSPKEIDAITGGPALINRSSRPPYRPETSLTTTTAGR
jgi:transcriptional regulator with XRE-family HTH domain